MSSSHQHPSAQLMQTPLSAPLAYPGLRVVILGLARQGMAAARFFLAEGARVTLSDLRG